MVLYLRYAAKLVVPCRAFLRRLRDSIAEPDGFVYFTPDIRDDLDWWGKFLHSWDGVRILRKVVDREARHVSTDASGNIGIGGCILEYPAQAPRLDTVFSRRIPPTFSKKVIEFNEMRAIRVALRLWISDLTGKVLHIFNNNRNVCSGLKKLSIEVRL